MAGQYDSYSDGLGVNTQATPSPLLWSKVDASLERPNAWIHDYQDFRNLPATLNTTADVFGPCEAYASAGATFLTLDEDGGPRQIVEATDDEGFAIRMGSQPFKIIQGHGELVFECRVKKQEVALASNLFVGLIEAVIPSVTVPLTAAGAITDNNYVGYVSLEADPDAIIDEYQANGIAGVNTNSSIALVADTYIKLGFVFNRDGDNKLWFYTNGQKQATSKAIPSAAGTDFPNDVRMGWIVAAIGGAASSVNVTADWIRVAQERVTP